MEGFGVGLLQLTKTLGLFGDKAAGRLLPAVADVFSAILDVLALVEAVFAPIGDVLQPVAPALLGPSRRWLGRHHR